MTTSKKIWLGILTFLPFLLAVVYVFLFLTLFLGKIDQFEHSHGDEFPLELIQHLFVIFIPIILAAIISLAIMIYYIVHANNNPKNDSGKKIMWTLILIFITSIGCVVYYFVEILPTQSNTPESLKVND